MLVLLELFVVHIFKNNCFRGKKKKTSQVVEMVTAKFEDHWIYLAVTPKSRPYISRQHSWEASLPAAAKISRDDDTLTIPQLSHPTAAPQGNFNFIVQLIFLLPLPLLSYVLAIMPTLGDFPGGTVVGTPHSQCRGPGFNPWSGN